MQGWICRPKERGTWFAHLQQIDSLNCLSPTFHSGAGQRARCDFRGDADLRRVGSNFVAWRVTTPVSPASSRPVSVWVAQRGRKSMTMSCTIANFIRCASVRLWARRTANSAQTEIAANAPMTAPQHSDRLPRVCQHDEARAAQAPNTRIRPAPPDETSDRRSSHRRDWRVGGHQPAVRVSRRQARQRSRPESRAPEVTDLRTGGAHERISVRREGGKE